MSTQTDRRRRAGGGDEVATRRRVLDAAMSTIVECGFYRASSNEIARRAEVTWGVIQHHFGTREALMVAVVKDWSEKFAEAIEAADVSGDTTAERIEKLLDVLAGLYGTPEYLAHIQILLNLEHDPRTGADVRSAMRATVERANEPVRRLLHDAVGPGGASPTLATTIFHTLRGAVLSQQLLDAMAYDKIGNPARLVPRQRRILVEMVAAHLDRT